MDAVERRVVERVKATNAWRAQFLGLAFALTFVVSMIGDALSMGSLRGHAFMAGQLVAALLVSAVVRWTPFGRQHAGAVFAAGIALVSASGAAHLTQFGGFDGPWFYGCYVAPPIFITILLPLAVRAAATFGTSAAFLGIYWLFRPDLFDHPMAHIPVLYLATVSAISVGIGHYVHRLELVSFADAARFEELAVRLESQLRETDAAPTALRLEIARQLHDDVAQLITGARLHLAGSLPGRASGSPAERVAVLLDELAGRTRRMLAELREPPQTGGLVEELEQLRRDYGALGLRVEVVLDPAAMSAIGAPVPVLVATAREALTNALRHGKASEATVNVFEEAGAFELRVLDNGGGRVEGLREGYGLLGIRERVASVGGTAELGEYEEGLRLSVSLPRRTGS